MPWQVEGHSQKLYDYILERGTIVPIHEYDEDLLRKGDVSRVVTESIRRGTSDWEKLVPNHVKHQVGQPMGGNKHDVCTLQLHQRLTLSSVPSVRCIESVCSACNLGRAEEHAQIGLCCLWDLRLYLSINSVWIGTFLEWRFLILIEVRVQSVY